MNQINLFGLRAKSEEEEVEEAIKLLQSKGYIVRMPPEDKHKVDSPKKMVYFFYATLERFNPELKTSYNVNLKKDVATAKKFLQAQMDRGASEKAAYIICCDLIETMFAQEDQLKLNFKISSINILTQPELSWIIDKVSDIYNERNILEQEKRDEEFYQRLQKETEVKPVTDEEYIKFLNKLEGILSNG